MSARRLLALGCLFEGGLLLVAVPLGRGLGQPLLAHCRFGLTASVVGIWAAVAPLLFFFWSMHTRSVPFQRIRLLLEQGVAPVLAPLHLWQLGLLSLVAGVGEEALFRGAIQLGLSAHLGPVVGLLLGSLLFGMAHLITPFYGFVAALIGLYLGALLIGSGNLVVPVLCHSVYDFVALVYLLHFHGR